MVTICPWPPFHPTKLRQFGLNVTGNFISIKENYINLIGIDGNIPAKELWKYAGWNIDDVIKNVQTNGIHKLKLFDDIKKGRWRKTSTYIGPCFTYFPILNETETIISFNFYPKATSCLSEKESKIIGRSRWAKNESECEYSNGFDQFFRYNYHKLDSIYVLYHWTHQIDHFMLTDNVQSISDKVLQNFMDGRYSIDMVSTDGSASQLTKKKYNLIKDKCNSDLSFSTSSCYKKCLEEKVSNTLDCKPLTSINMKAVLREVCRKQESIDEIDTLGSLHCKVKCPPRCRRLEYEHHTHNTAFRPEVNMTLISTDVTTLRELEVYPFSKLLSDVGGILSLFLGISTFLAVFSVWKLLANRSNRKCPEVKVNNRRRLALLSIGMFTFAETLIHLLLTIQLYVTQPVIKSAHIDRSEVRIQELLFRRDNLEDALARRLASRTLNCRPIETTEMACKVDCVLKLSLPEVNFASAFISVDDLKYCDEMFLPMQSNEAVMSTEVLSSLQKNKTVQSCSNMCQYHTKNLSKTQEKTSKHIEVNPRYYIFSVFELVSRVGGVIGLYLGISVFNASDFISHQYSKCIIETKYHFSGTIKTFAIIGCVSLLIWQAKVFFIGHQIEVTSSYESLTFEHAPTITFCVWPPFNVSKLQSLLGNEAFEFAENISTGGRTKVMEDFLNDLPGKWPKPIDVMWEETSWELRDVVSFIAIKNQKEGALFFFDCDRGRCQNLFIKKLTFLNNCFSLNITHLKMIAEATLLFNRNIFQSNSFYVKPTLYAAFHSYGDEVNINDLQPVSSIYETSASVVSSIYDTSRRLPEIKYNDCVLKCYSLMTVRKYRCRLPYMILSTKYRLCNQTQYKNVPKIMSHLPTFTSSGLITRKNSTLSPNKDIAAFFTKCSRICGKYRVVHHGSAMVTEIRYTETSTLRVSMMPFSEGEDKKALSINEKDRYTLVNVISDAGSLLGVTIGTSILSVLQAIAP